MAGRLTIADAGGGGLAGVGPVGEAAGDAAGVAAAGIAVEVMRASFAGAFGEQRRLLLRGRVDRCCAGRLGGRGGDGLDDSAGGSCPEWAADAAACGGAACRTAAARSKFKNPQGGRERWASAHLTPPGR